MLKRHHIVLSAIVLLYAIVVSVCIAWYSSGSVSYLNEDNMQETYRKVNAYQIVFNKAFDTNSKDLKQLNEEIESIKDLMLSIGVSRNVEVYDLFEYKKTVALLNIAIENLRYNHKTVLRLAKKDFLTRVKKEHKGFSRVPYDSFIAQIESPSQDIVDKLSTMGLTNLEISYQLKNIKQTFKVVQYLTFALFLSVLTYLAYLYLSVKRVKKPSTN
tara:strand:+ start:446 stop:1090 length:645 start_codon:yes stop_codon:yes gene_type:complete